MPQFRAKARAVDLLGKSQIADLPTAISELWKNGYDAYGDNLEAYLYAKAYQGYKEPVFVLSDDGKGMSREDILDRWFVLGTDSKSRNEEDELGEDTLYKEPRIKMGEKGIGRLSVAYLGPQMLMLTKKRRCPLEAVFFDWRVLENYNLFLEDINIPLKTLDEGKNDSFFEELKKEFLLNFSRKVAPSSDPWKDQKELKARIFRECEQLDLPSYIIDDFIKNKRFNGPKSNGTAFIIFHPDKQILDLENSLKKDVAKELVDDQSVNHTIATLVGLFNLFKTYNSSHKTQFHLINKEGQDNDLLTLWEFFDPDDFNEADHSIQGKFDEFGIFTGKVRVYNKIIDHQFVPVKRQQKTHYGPFNIKLGYVQALPSETIVNPEKKKIIDKKLEIYGGLFIYRDGFRVLPYGRPDSDFLEFEERRSRSAGENFFSKRRMFGYLEISRKENEKLKDKSSREGFITNAAYRDFRQDLIAFFIDLQKKYFSTKAEFDYKRVQQEELVKLSNAAKQEKQREIDERRKFARLLSELPQELDKLEKDFFFVIKLLREKATDPAASYAEIQPLLHTITQSKIKLSDLRLTRPVRFKPTALQNKKFTSYEKRYAGFSKAVSDSAAVTESLRDKLKIIELFAEFEAKGELYKNTLSGRLSEFEDRLDVIFRNSKEQMARERATLLREFEEKCRSILPAKDNAEDISRSTQLLENVFNEAKDRMTDRVDPYLNHLERMSLEVNEDDLIGYYKYQFEEMQKEWEQTYELAQLGIAVEIIDHQFGALYSALASNIQSLQDYLADDPSAVTKYQSLVNSFTHLEENYKLLQPLYRTTGKIPKNVTGKELHEYLMEFLKDTLLENNIVFNITTVAEAWSVYSYESIFKPVLINIINNAIYWLQPADPRKIVMDVKDGSFLILNSGLKIDDSALEEIFNLFYSEKPKGRGVGLYLAKRSLNGIGFEISASNDPKYNYLNGACFVISPTKP